MGAGACVPHGKKSVFSLSKDGSRRVRGNGSDLQMG